MSVQPITGFPPPMDALDAWMELPLSGKHKADGLPDEGRFKSAQKTKSGKRKTGKPASSAGRDRPDPPVNRALVNLDSRVRSLEDISEDAIDTQSDLPEVAAALQVGPKYQSFTQQSMKGRKIGSAHTFIWAAFAKTMAKSINCPPELQQLLLAHIQQCNNTPLIKCQCCDFKL